MKSRVFIGSSSEHVDTARAIQENLHGEFDATVWDQAVFAVATYPVDALIEQLDRVDFGVFVLAPEDWLRSRGTLAPAPRDNVVFELGMFIGRLGRQRAFVVAPRGKLKLPSDLDALTVAQYIPPASGGNLVAALGPACNKIRRAMRQRLTERTGVSVGLLRAGVFQDFTAEFDGAIRSASQMTLSFIHSRRWRENHADRIREFLQRPGTKLTVFLPDATRRSMILEFVDHFEDGPSVPRLLADAYDWFANLAEEFPKRVSVRLAQLYPTYSFYRFDDRAIVAMYPTTRLKKPVPTFDVRLDGLFGGFIETDCIELERTARKVGIDDLRKLSQSRILNAPYWNGSAASRGRSVGGRGRRASRSS